VIPGIETDKTAAKLVLLDVPTRLVLVQAGIASSHAVGDGRFQQACK
jgi:hypothetical protein